MLRVRILATLCVATLALETRVVARDESDTPHRVPSTDPTWLSSLTADELREVIPHMKAANRAAIDRWTQIMQELAEAQYRIDEPLAKKMIAELWHDTGYPAANRVVQFTGLGFIDACISMPSVNYADAEAEAVLRDGLVDFYNAGAAQMPTKSLKR